MGRRKGSRRSVLQVKKDGEWRYVFCRNVRTGIVTTKKRSKALAGRSIGYFREKFGNDSFRTTTKA